MKTSNLVTPDVGASSERDCSCTGPHTGACRAARARRKKFKPVVNTPVRYKGQDGIITQAEDAGHVRVAFRRNDNVSWLELDVDKLEILGLPRKPPAWIHGRTGRKREAGSLVTMVTLDSQPAQSELLGDFPKFRSFIRTFGQRTNGGMHGRHKDYSQAIAAQEMYIMARAGLFRGDGAKKQDKGSEQN